MGTIVEAESQSFLKVKKASTDTFCLLLILRIIITRFTIHQIPELNPLALLIDYKKILLTALYYLVFRIRSNVVFK